MPTVSRFFGISIRVYYDDHGPPHFHAYYGEHSATIDVTTLTTLEGSLPRRVRALVLEWAAEHRAELIENWRLAEEHQPLKEPRVCTVKALDGFRLEIGFTDGTAGVIALSDRLFGPMFEPLRDPSFFAKAFVDEFGAVCWPNGADLAPDAIYQQLRSAAPADSADRALLEAH